jgi:hypothetical protein
VVHRTALGVAVRLGVCGRGAFRELADPGAAPAIPPRRPDRHPAHGDLGTWIASHPRGAHHARELTSRGYANGLIGSFRTRTFIAQMLYALRVCRSDTPMGDVTDVPSIPGRSI